MVLFFFILDFCFVWFVFLFFFFCSYYFVLAFVSVCVCIDHSFELTWCHSCAFQSQFQTHQSTNNKLLQKFSIRNRTSSRRGIERRALRVCVCVCTKWHTKIQTNGKPKQRIREWVKKKEVNTCSLFFNSYRFPYISHKTYRIHLPKIFIARIEQIIVPSLVCDFFFSFHFWYKSILFHALSTYIFAFSIDWGRSKFDYQIVSNEPILVTFIRLI